MHQIGFQQPRQVEAFQCPTQSSSALPPVLSLPIAAMLNLLPTCTMAVPTDRKWRDPPACFALCAGSAKPRCFETVARLALEEGRHEAQCSLANSHKYPSSQQTGPFQVGSAQISYAPAHTAVDGVGVMGTFSEEVVEVGCEVGLRVTGGATIGRHEAQCSLANSHKYPSPQQTGPSQLGSAQVSYAPAQTVADGAPAGAGAVVSTSPGMGLGVDAGVLGVGEAVVGMAVVGSGAEVAPENLRTLFWHGSAESGMPTVPVEPGRAAFEPSGTTSKSKHEVYAKFCSPELRAKDASQYHWAT